MKSRTISDLPTELHCCILKYTLDDARERTAEEEGESSRTLRKWVEIDTEKPLQFPYNVAGVCRLWHSILVRWPECWTRVIIDVAFNPQRFLDIFLWSKDIRRLEVIVINSHEPDPQDLKYSKLERRRVAMIVEALRPHIARCELIKFNVAFFTSLPSPVIFLLDDAPYLRHLSLDCKIDDGGHPDEYSSTCDIGVHQRIRTCTSLPALSYLSMTGFWFMLLASHQHTSGWLKNLRKSLNSWITLSITRFQFQESGDYSMANFVVYCSTMKPLSKLYLHYLSLHESPGSSLQLESDALALPYYSDVFTFPGMNAIYFEGVTPNFLHSIFFFAKFSPSRLYFSACLFPYESLRSNASCLSITKMPDPPLADSWMEYGSMFRSILPNWTGSDLVIDSCPSFNDDVFDFMLRPGEPFLQFLDIRNCKNFTVHGVRQFLGERNAIIDEDGRDIGDAMDEITVRGNCPFPSEEDQTWLDLNGYTKWTKIDWKTTQEGSDTEQCFKTLGQDSSPSPEDDYAEGESESDGGD